jgi:hypothetical protein
MAFHVIEFSDVARGPVPVPVYPPVALKELAIGGSSTAMSSVINARTRFVRIRTTAACRFTLAATPTAVDDETCERLAAGEVTEFYVQPNSSLKLAVITAA